MKLSLSVRVAEKFHAKREASMALEGLAEMVGPLEAVGAAVAQTL